MRRIFFVVCMVLFGVCLTLSAAAAPALTDGGGGEGEGAAAPTEAEGTEASDWFDRFRAALPSAVAEEADPERAETLVGMEHFFSVLATGVRDGQAEWMATLFSLLGITVLGGVGEMLAEDTPGGIRQPVNLCVTVGAALAFYHTLSGALTRVESYLGDLLHFADGLAPVVGALWLTGGGTATAAASTGGMAILMLIVENFCIGVLTPLAAACFAFSLIGSLGKEVRVDGIAKTLRGTYLTLMGLICAVATASFSLQSVLAAGRDSVAVRTARFAVGNMIPIVGNAIGASLGTLNSSLSLIKNTVGVSGVAAVLMLTVPIFLHLYMTRLSVGICGALARLIGFRAGEGLLDDFQKIFDMMLAVTGFVSVTFVMYLAVLIRTAYPVGV